MTTAEQRTSAALMDAAIVRRALVDALMKFDPRLLVRNPVMFIVAIGATLASGALIAVPRSGAKVTAGAIGVLALGLSVGAFLVMPLGADPNVPRDAGALVCMYPIRSSPWLSSRLLTDRLCHWQYVDPIHNKHQHLFC